MVKDLKEHTLYLGDERIEFMMSEEERSLSRFTHGNEIGIGYIGNVAHADISKILSPKVGEEVRQKIFEVANALYVSLDKEYNIQIRIQESKKS